MTDRGRPSDAAIVVGDHVRRREGGDPPAIGAVVGLVPGRPPWGAVLVRWADRSDEDVEEDPHGLVRVTRPEEGGVVGRW